MKKLTLLTAALVAVGLVSTASAQNTPNTAYVYITGSSAFRGNVNAALHGTAIFDAAPTINGTYSSTASQLSFSGTIGGNNVIVKTSFTGSEAGIASLTGVTVQNNVVDGNGVAHNGNLPGTPTPSFLPDSGSTTFSHAPDIAMSDTSQAVSLTQGTSITRVGGAPVGIVQFVWMKGANNGQTGWSDLVNINIPQLATLLSAGEQALSFVTGVPADSASIIAVTGRNKGSGTRVNCMIESLHGIGNGVVQYAINPVYTGGVLVKAGKATGITDSSFQSIGNDGYDSGGGVAGVLASTGSSLTTVPIGYIGLVDATSSPLTGTALTGSTLTFDANGLPVNGFSAPAGGTSQFLTLNGMTYSDAAIVMGAYDYFGHENMYRANAANATAVSVAGNLFTALHSTLTGGLNGIPADSMLADRPSDTGFVAPF